MYDVYLHPKVVSIDLPKIGSVAFKIVHKAIEQKLIPSPLFYSFPLRQGLKGHRKLRVGDYRIIYKIEELKVHIICIGHRSVVYDIAEKRI